LVYQTTLQHAQLDEFGFANLTGIKPYTNNGPKFFDVCGFMNGKTTFGGLQDCLFKTSWILATNLDRFPSIDSSEDLLEQCRENLCDSLEMLRNFASKYEQHFERFPIQNVIDIGFKNTQMYFLVVWYPLLNFPITRIKLENYFAYYSKMLQTDDARKLGVLIPEQLNSGYLDYKFKNSADENNGSLDNRCHNCYKSPADPITDDERRSDDNDDDTDDDTDDDDDDDDQSRLLQRKW
ncbi:hypothetical protein TYRP_017297, partial [Tyrophagus putrescentiae]